MREFLACLTGLISSEDAIIAFFTFLATSAAWYSAYVSKRAVDSQLKPVLGLYNGFPTPQDERGHPLVLKFRNLSDGVAHLRVVDLAPGVGICSCLEAHIDPPTSAGPRGDCGIKVWLPEPRKSYTIRPVLYYWDAIGNCHRTDAVVTVEWRSNRYAEWRVTAQETKLNLKQWQWRFPPYAPVRSPNKLLHWSAAGRELFTKVKPFTRNTD